MRWRCSQHPPPHAAADADLAQIRDEIRQLKDSYEARIQALEQRLKEAEAKTAAAPQPVAAPSAPPAPVPPVATAPPSAPTGGLSAFNPAISAVLQGVYTNLSQDPDRYAIHGFATGGEIAPPKRGFSIGESELGLSASVDDKIFGNLIFSLTPENTVEVEEAYGMFTAIPNGFTPKIGRFLSAIGYLNDQHQHVWDFFDAPLPYQAFLGGQFKSDGLQLKWVAPTETFLEFGGEIGDGSSFPGADRNRNGIGSGAAYVHAGGDIGTSNSWRAGLSYLQLRPNGREYTLDDLAGNSAQLAFSGKSQLAIADFVWKWAPYGNAKDTNFKLQGEYFWRKENGESHVRQRRRARPHQHVGLLVEAAGLVHRRRLPVHALLARGRALRPTHHGQRELRGQRHLPRAGLLQSAALFDHGRLHAVGVQPVPRPVAAKQGAARGDRQPALRPIHPDAWRARRAQILKRPRMNRLLKMTVGIALAVVAAPALAVLNVFATMPEWSALTAELGGDKVAIYTATNALQDAHHVEAKPSLIARARSADLVVATGAELEIGWLPLVTQQAGNPKIQPGKPGYFEATAYVTLLEKPARLDRSEGDVHPGGNPHIQTDPRNIARVAAPLAARLAELDPANAAYYQARYKAFAERWNAAIANWEKTGGAAQGHADRRAAQGVHLSRGVARTQ